MSNREDQCYVGKLLKALYDYKSEKLAGLVGFDTVCLQSAQVFFNRNESPFELAMEQQPLTPHKIAKQCSASRCPLAYKFAITKQELMQEAPDNLLKAQQRMKKYADKGRRLVEFQVRDKVLLC